MKIFLFAFWFTMQTFTLLKFYDWFMREKPKEKPFMFEQVPLKQPEATNWINFRSEERILSNFSQWEKPSGKIPFVFGQFSYN